MRRVITFAGVVLAVVVGFTINLTPQPREATEWRMFCAGETIGLYSAVVCRIRTSGR